MNVLPENARQFAMLKVNGIGLRGFCYAERNALHSLANLQNGSVAACLFFPYIQVTFCGSVFEQRLIWQHYFRT